MKLFTRKPKTQRVPMTQHKRNIIGVWIAVLGSLATIGIGAPAAQAATMQSCYIWGAGPDHHMNIRHGEVYASVDYTWFEETFLGYHDGIRYFGTTPAWQIGTRPYWINGC